MDDLQTKLTLAKGEYKTALKNLERISDEIHERRRSSAMGPRGCGVGAEGSSTSVEDLSGSKPEPDAVSGESDKCRITQLVWKLCFQSCLLPGSPSSLPITEGLQSWAVLQAASGGFPCFVEHCSLRC